MTEHAGLFRLGCGCRVDNHIYMRRMFAVAGIAWITISGRTGTAMTLIIAAINGKSDRISDGIAFPIRSGIAVAAGSDTAVTGHAGTLPAAAIIRTVLVTRRIEDNSDPRIIECSVVMSIGIVVIIVTHRTGDVSFRNVPDMFAIHTTAARRQRIHRT